MLRGRVSFEKLFKMQDIITRVVLDIAIQAHSKCPNHLWRSASTNHRLICSNTSFDGIFFEMLKHLIYIQYNIAS